MTTGRAPRRAVGTLWPGDSAPALLRASSWLRVRGL